MNRNFRQRLRQIHPAFLCVALLAVAYSIWAVVLWVLTPTTAYDAFSYFWLAPLNRHFFTGRSLTQRALFFILGNNPQVVAYAQLVFHFLLACVLYMTFRPSNGLVRNLLVTGAVLFFCSSYTFNVAAAYVGPEPIFIDLLLIFSCVLFGRQTRNCWLLILGVGILLIFSKTVAPFACIIMLGLRAVMEVGKLPKRLPVVFLALTVLSLASTWISLTYDTSIHVNTVNNVFAHVFPDPDLTKKFERQHGMPTGPFTYRCAQGNARSDFDGQPLLKIDWKTRNFDIRDDRFGFAQWIRERGRGAYARHLLFNPIETLRTTNQAFHDSYTNNTLGAISEIMLKLNHSESEPSNYDKLQAVRGHWDGGLLGIDSLQLSAKITAGLGLANLFGIGLCALIAFALSRLRPDLKQFDLSCAALVVSLPLFFLCYFGDAMEIDRHVLPPIILNVFGMLTFAYACGVAVFQFGHERFSRDDRPLKQ